MIRYTIAYPDVICNYYKMKIFVSKEKDGTFGSRLWYGLEVAVPDFQVGTSGDGDRFRTFGEFIIDRNVFQRGIGHAIKS